MRQGIILNVKLSTYYIYIYDQERKVNIEIKETVRKLHFFVGTLQLKQLISFSQPIIVKRDYYLPKVCRFMNSGAGRRTLNISVALVNLISDSLESDLKIKTGNHCLVCTFSTTEFNRGFYSRLKLTKLQFSFY